MKQLPPALKKGDLIRIVAPAKSIEATYVDHAAALLTESGYRVKVSEHCLGSYNYFSGTLKDRLSDFQEALDDQETKAILCARGGYGSIQLVDKLDWSVFQLHPKWVIGFSDITVFHQRLACMGYGSIHGSMPLNFQENSNASIETLLSALENGIQPKISVAYNHHNHLGEAVGTLVGGNASIVYSMLGTNDHPEYDGSILFLEDLAEQIYHIDRIFHAFDKSGILSKINGMIIGGMTDMKDTAVPFGSSVEEIIHHHLKRYNIPLVFDFPSGHIDDNRALVLGDKVILHSSDNGAFLDHSV
ncbi:MAG: LD-carboxypeptidase [Bacteroidetes bacterium]|nr:MAG: LD-carboxypeptidase [Bacteroidota bacterium]